MAIRTNHPTSIQSTQHSPQTAEGTIIDRVAQFIERFIFLKDSRQYRLLATWTVGTYLVKRFEYFGYLFIYSPEPQCGKSLLLDILDNLVYASSGVLISPTPSVLFRTAHERTQLLDEVDSLTNMDALRGILNAGFKKGGKVLRNDSGEKQIVTKEFPVYGPRALAGIGLSILHGTTRDRAFAFQMFRQKTQERRERFRAQKIKPELKALKRDIESWVHANASQVESTYNDAAFPYLEEFRDRTIDVAQSLAAIHEVCYKGHPRLMQTRLELIGAIATTRKEEDAPTTEYYLFQELLRLAEIEDPLKGSASELSVMCAGLAETVSESQITAFLRKFGFQTKSVRKGESTRYRYVLPRATLEDLCARYAGGIQSHESRVEMITAT